MKIRIPNSILLLTASIFLTGYVANASSLRGNGIEFIPNRGQVVDDRGQKRPDILYVADESNAKIFLRTGGISYVMTGLKDAGRLEELEEDLEAKGVSRVHIAEAMDSLRKQLMAYSQRVDMEFSGSSPFAQTSTDNYTEGYYNYYYKQCPQGITGVRGCGKVTYHEIYPGTDVSFYGGKDGGLEYDFILKPGAEVDLINLKYTGAESLSLESDGKLQVKMKTGETRERIPAAYQFINGSKKFIPAGYKLDGQSVKIQVGNYDKTQPLVIDPWTTWITYFGGSSDEYTGGVAADASGNIFVSGYTASANFPASAGYQMTCASCGGFNYPDAFVVKLSNAGARIWATYYGGSDIENSFGIASDASGNVFIDGWTYSNDFPVSGGYQMTCASCGSGSMFGGQPDAFLVKLNSAGARQWATFYGGTSTEYAYGLASDVSGNVFFTGSAYSADFPVVSGQQMTCASCGVGYLDAFLVKFNGAGARQWATFYGGAKDEEGMGVGADAGGNVSFTGYTYSSDFPVASGYQASCASCASNKKDAFVVLFNGAGVRQWGTFYGGNLDETGHSLATDPGGNVYVSGETYSTNFPVLSAYQGTLSGGGNSDGFLMKFNGGGTRQWATYYGGGNYEENTGVAVDQTTSNVFATYETYSTNFPVTGGACQSASGGGSEDHSLVSFSSVGSRLGATYVGGSGHEEMGGFSSSSIVSAGSCVYIAGYTPGSYPVTAGGFQTNYGGGTYDIVVAQLPNDCSCNGTCTVLPVELQSFTGHCEGDINLLEWTTASETSNAWFIIERSNDGEHFEEIGKKMGSGNSEQKEYYSYTDQNPFPGTNYYRLKQIDFSGDFSYSNTISIIRSPGHQILIYPNPAGAALNCGFYNTANETASFTVTDIIGNILREERVKVVRGQNNFTVGTAGLSPGMYILNLYLSGRSLQSKFIKQ